MKITDGLVLDHLTIFKGAKRLVALSAHVKKGEVLTLMAPSGAGKSTALAAIVGALDPFFRQHGKYFLTDKISPICPFMNAMSEFCCKMIFCFPICR